MRQMFRHRPIKSRLKRHRLFYDQENPWFECEQKSMTEKLIRSFCFQVEYDDNLRKNISII